MTRKLITFLSVAALCAPATALATSTMGASAAGMGSKAAMSHHSELPSFKKADRNHNGYVSIKEAEEAARFYVKIFPKSRIDKVLQNAEIQALIMAIGAGLAEDFDLAKARYHKVIILADADVAVSHIRTLLLTFFLRQMKPLVEAGFVYVAQPPLYSTLVGNSKIYLKDDAARTAFLAEHPNHNKDFQRLKGLGEMDWDELKETTMDSSKRSLLQISMEQAALAHEACSVLMGDDVEMRRRCIQTNATDVRFLDFSPGSGSSATSAAWMPWNYRETLDRLRTS